MHETQGTTMFILLTECNFSVTPEEASVQLTVATRMPLVLCVWQKPSILLRQSFFHNIIDSICFCIKKRLINLLTGIFQILTDSLTRNTVRLLLATKIMV